MTKKIIVLFMFIFLLCGCSAQVDLKVDKYSIDETISIIDYANETTSKTQVFNSYRKYMPVDNSVIIADTEPDERKSRVDYYDRTFVDLGNGYNFLYKYNYDFDDYSKSRSLNSAYKSSFISYNSKDNVVILSTDSAGTQLFNQYKQLDSLKINITSDYEVINSNADIKNGKTHTWDLSRTNNKQIYIEYKVTKPTSTVVPNPGEEDPEVPGEEEEEDKKEYSLELAMLVVVAGIAGFILIVVMINSFDRRKYR